MPKPLLLIVTCEKNAVRSNAQRSTWVPDAVAAGFDVVFSRAGSGVALPDELLLDVDDSYEGLPAKVKASMRWAYDRGYEHVFKLDDDVLVRPAKLLLTPFRAFDYYGFPSWGGFRSGFCYSLSRRAMKLIADAEIDPAQAGEDRWVYAVLSTEAGITIGDADADTLVLCGSRRPKVNYITSRTAAAAEFFNEKEMREAYQHIDRGPRGIKWRRR